MKQDSTLYTRHSTLDKPVLLISASDSSGAAGMQVDLRVLGDLGAPVRCAVTAVTVQGDGGAKNINPVDPEILVDSINTALSDAPGIGAVKVGLLGDGPTAEALEDPLSVIKALNIPIVVDPVMRSTPGSPLSTAGTASAILEKVLPWTTLVTPNRYEFEALSSLIHTGDSEQTSQVLRIMGKGVRGVLVTGGDTKEEMCTDILYEAGGASTEFRHPRIGMRAPRGTGCALSTAIAVHLARGFAVKESVERAIGYVTGLIERAAVVGDQLLLFPGKKP